MMYLSVIVVLVTFVFANGTCFEEPSCGCINGPANTACSTSIPGTQPYCYVPVGCPGSKGGTLFDPNTYQYCDAIPCTEKPVYPACKRIIGGGLCDNVSPRLSENGIYQCCPSGNNGVLMQCVYSPLVCTCEIPQVCPRATLAPTFEPTFPPTFLFTFAPIPPPIVSSPVPFPVPSPVPFFDTKPKKASSSSSQVAIVAGIGAAVLTGIAGVTIWHVRKQHASASEAVVPKVNV